MSPTISAICRFPNFEGSPGGLDGGTKSMKSNRGMLYDVCAIKARQHYRYIMQGPSLHVLASAGDHQRKANKQSADAIAP